MEKSPKWLVYDGKSFIKTDDLGYLKKHARAPKDPPRPAHMVMASLPSPMLAWQKGGNISDHFSYQFWLVVWNIFYFPIYWE